MDVPLRLRIVPSPSWLLWLVLVVVLISIVGLAIVGMHPRVPPFGPARNGPMVYDSRGDLFRLDPATGVATTLVSDLNTDFSPSLSADGSLLVFGRRGAEGVLIMVAEASGANIRTAFGPIGAFDSGGMSGDGHYLALIDLKGEHYALSVYDVRSDTNRVLDLGGLEPFSLSWLPPAGTEIVFRGQRATSGHSGVFAIRPDGTGLRGLTPENGLIFSGYGGPLVSPDGKRLAYTEWEGHGIIRTHVIDLDSGRSVVLPDLSPTSHVTAVAWSPDATTLLANVNTLVGPPPAGGIGQLYLFAADGRSAGRPLGPSFELDLERDHPHVDDPPGITADFSPDGTTVLMVHALDLKLWRLPVDGSEGTVSDYPSQYLPWVQRLQP